MNDDWKLTDAEVERIASDEEYPDELTLCRAIADAAGRKALEWAARQCEEHAISGSLSCLTFADVIRAGSKP